MGNNSKSVQKRSDERKNAKKKRILGEAFGTAYARLRKDILFSLVDKLEYTCYRCGFPMTRDTFSIEHKENWLNAENSKELFFDLDNISFSHSSCNTEDAAYHQRKGRVVAGVKTRVRDEYDPVRRHKQYLRTGK